MVKQQFYLTELFSWAIFSVALLALAAISIAQRQPLIGQNEAFFYYLKKLFANHTKEVFIWFVAPYLCFVLLRIYWFLTYSTLKKTGSQTNLSAFRQFLAKCKDDLYGSLRIILPLIFTFLASSQILGTLNKLNATRLVDLEALAWDKKLTSVYPFITWSGESFPSWFINLVIYSFGALGFLIFLLGSYLLHYRRRLFREFAAAFGFSLLISLPLWYAIPILSPHDRFIDNVYNLPTPPEISQEVASFHPIPEISEFLKTVRESKTKNLSGVYPTSTFPSAHVEWATLITLYAFRTKKRAVFIPILLIATLSTLGTFLLLQHYFVDIPAGIFVAVLAFLAVSFLEKIDRGEKRDNHLATIS